MLNGEPISDQKLEYQPSCIGYEIFPLTFDPRHLFNVNHVKIKQSKLVQSIRENHAYLSHIIQFEVEDLLEQLSRGEIS